MSTVKLEKKEHIAWLTLNRPEKLNVLGPDMPSELKKCTEAIKNDPQIRCVIIQGAGDHFMAGGDIDHFKMLVDAYAKEGESALPGDMFDLLHAAILNIQTMNKPVIASVQGAVAGFGLSLMLA
ncbi:MAG: enoyl-CoA hydratase/isomerase family protein, partial [Cycloclasticus sp.]|nr:enoyl-CoA hydratase/isomerase family protein [Cycloclasticus sp.]